MSAVRIRRSLGVLHAVDEVRAAHPGILDKPLTITTLRRVLAHERIDVLRQPIKAYAYVEGGLGTYVIVMRAGLNPRWERRVLGHEYAHVKLHYQESGEVVYQRHACRRGDPTELEAQLFVRLLELGPDATPDHPEIAKFVAALDAPALKTKVPPQIEIPFAIGVPMYKAPAGPAFDGTGSFNRFAGEPRRSRYQGPKIKVGDSHDSLLFDWTWKGIPLGFFAGNRGWCDIWDTMPAPETTRRSRDVLVCGDRRVTWRDFVFSSIERYRYEFAEGESRDRSPKALNRQIERATKLAVSIPISADLIFRARKGNAS